MLARSSAFLHRNRWATPYALLLPGMAYLVIFFLWPMYYLLKTSLEQGSLETGYTFNWAWRTYSDAISLFQPQFIRSFEGITSYT